MHLKTKLFASAVALTMVLGVAIPAAAQTTAELTAQINSLLAMIAQLQAQIAGGAGAGVATTFTTDLTVGSTGAQVTALQTFLVSKGFLTMPAGVAMGYFGSLTKSALAAYQASVGISPAVGYFGPITRAKVNALAVTPVTPGVTPVTPGVISTPGAEGTITVTSANGNTVSTAYAGDSKDKILGFKVQAAGSDVAVQRVKVDLGGNTTQYTKLWQTLYIVDDAGNTLATLPMNSSNVVKDSGEYYATLTGFSSVVPKGTTKQFYVAADLYSTVDSTYQSGGDYAVANTTYNKVMLADSGVRAVDGAGIDQYGPTTGSTISYSPSISGALTDLATLTVSSDASTPQSSSVVANNGANNDQYDQLPLLTFDVQAKKDSVEITDMTVRVVKTGSGLANASTTVYLFDGSTPIGSASLGSDTATGNYAVFSNINYTIPKDVTKALTLKADIRSASATGGTFVAYASSTSMDAQSSNGTTVASTYKSGAVTGNSITALSKGPVITLTSKSITAPGAPQSGGSTTFSTSTLQATFNLHITAVGGAVTFGTVASSAPAFASSTYGFKVYVNGAAKTSTLAGYASSTSWSFPTACSTAGQTGGNSCVLSENTSMDVPVTFIIEGRDYYSAALTPALYSVQMSGVQYVVSGILYSGTTASNFMDGLTDWRTADISFP